MKTLAIPCLVFAALAAANTAHAAMIGALDGTPVLVTSGPFAGSYAFNYSATLNAGDRLDATATNNIGNCANPGAGTTDPSAIRSSRSMTSRVLKTPPRLRPGGKWRPSSSASRPTLSEPASITRA